MKAARWKAYEKTWMIQHAFLVSHQYIQPELCDFHLEWKYPAPRVRPWWRRLLAWIKGLFR